MLMKPLNESGRGLFIFLMEPEIQYYIFPGTKKTKSRRGSAPYSSYAYQEQMGLLGESGWNLRQFLK